MHKNPSDVKLSLMVPNLSGGGAERVMVTLANEFCRKVQSVDLIIINDDDMNYQAELSSEVNLVNLKTGRAVSSVFALRKYLIENNPDVLLTSLGHISSAAALSIYFAKNINTKLYVREDIAPKTVSVSDPFRFLVSRVQGWAYTKADGIIALCDDMASEIKAFYKLSTPIYTIYNPLKVDEIRSQSLEPMSPLPPWTADSRFVLGVGRLEQQKDFVTLIKAVAEVRKKHDVKLVILGEGGERENLVVESERLGMSDSLFMPGFVSNPYSFMREAVSFVLSSRREGLPNALIQALVCGAPCIATLCPTGPREVLGDGKYGELVDVQDYVTMSSRISDLLEQSPHKTISERQLAQRYHPQSVAQQYLERMLS